MIRLWIPRVSHFPFMKTQLLHFSWGKQWIRDQPPLTYVLCQQYFIILFFCWDAKLQERVSKRNWNSFHSQNNLYSGWKHVKSLSLTHRKTREGTKKSQKVPEKRKACRRSRLGKCVFAQIWGNIYKPGTKNKGSTFSPILFYSYVNPYHLKSDLDFH